VWCEQRRRRRPGSRLARSACNRPRPAALSDRLVGARRPVAAHRMRRR
jgi:hypothetical protein